MSDPTLPSTGPSLVVQGLSLCSCAHVLSCSVTSNLWTGDCRPKWSKTDREAEALYGIPYMWNLKKISCKKLYFQNRLRYLKDRLLWGRMAESDHQGVWDGQVHIAMFKMDNQQGLTVLHRVLLQLCGSRDGRECGREWMHIYACIPLLSTWNYNNIINCLYSKTKNSLIKRKKTSINFLFTNIN